MKPLFFILVLLTGTFFYKIILALVISRWDIATFFLILAILFTVFIRNVYEELDWRRRQREASKRAENGFKMDPWDQEKQDAC